MSGAHASTRPAPLAPVARVAVMDVLRGLALLGILLMNLEGFAGPPSVMGTGIDPALHGVDRWADAAIYVLVQGKFIALFSLLFGAGFAVMARRAEREGWSLGWVWWRRCLGLLVIGLAHALLVWSGDVLVTYALCGLVLLAFRDVLGRALAFVGLGLFLVPPLISLLAGLAGLALAGDPSWQHSLQAQADTMAALTQAQQSAYGQGNYAAATWQRLHDLGGTLTVLPMNGAQVLGLFMIGAWLAEVFAQPSAHARLLKCFRVGALPLGTALVCASLACTPWIAPGRVDLRTCLAAALFSSAALPLCLGYVAWVLHWLERPGMQRLAGRLAAAGRLALSNYLLQSLVCTWVFYGYGLGAFGLGRGWQVVFALGLFALQLRLSQAWLKSGRLGPAEWVLRMLTYARVPQGRTRP
ncbi:uncharacterized protein SAMN05428989_0912 [Pseudoxanthomonas sp. GM95]|uniref:DUF418 domain-containing protein n=1 Tax=Pseudoxanthomonas sp. GM95 TaxID=1881043 RepID=UPI0008ACFA31|nr:DUF418 domain-containing protein [Pseudoxanthomonas sp. GM95]SEK84256.1 uncharacterized protein SAMN05428989_0912 [Pseudoxanthomonas sp. GM95]